MFGRNSQSSMMFVFDNKTRFTDCLLLILKELFGYYFPIQKVIVYYYSITYSDWATNRIQNLSKHAKSQNKNKKIGFVSDSNE